MVFGMSSPGPVDRNGKKKFLGNRESPTPAPVPVQRLGGTHFVMDDGDDRYYRETKPTDGAPTYVKNPEGLKDIPYNEHFRIRTRTGHQLLFHNSEDLIYIGNSRGTAWIEFTSDGKIDIYAEDSINIRTKQDFNFVADRDINMEAGRNFNIKVNGEMHTHVVKDHILIVDANQKIHIKDAVDITYDTTYTHHVVGDVNVLFDATWKHKVTGQVDWSFQQGLNWDVGGGSGGGATVNSTIFGSEIVKRTGNVDYTVVGNRKLTTTGNLDINTGGNNNLTAGASTNIRSGGNHIETASVIHMNGPAAATAAAAAAPGGATAASEAVLPKILKTHSLPDLPAPNEDDVDKTVIVRRMPTAEPYPFHENLDATKVKPDLTDRDVDGRYEGESTSMRTPPGDWRKYKKPSDTPF
jgi:hypothetical protein